MKSSIRIEFDRMLRNVAYSTSSRRIAPPVPRSASKPTTAPKPKPNDEAAQKKTDESQVVRLLATLTEKISKQQSNRESHVQEMSVVIVSLSQMLAEHLVGKAIEANDLDITDIVAEAVEQLLPADKLLVKMHPKDKLNLDSNVAAQSWQERLEIVTDQRVPRGGCEVSVGEVALLSNLESRMTRIRESLLEGTDRAWLKQSTDGESDSE